jgi:hypothetical protein
VGTVGVVGVGSESGRNLKGVAMVVEVGEVVDGVGGMEELGGNKNLNGVVVIEDWNVNGVVVEEVVSGGSKENMVGVVEVAVAVEVEGAVMDGGSNMNDFSKPKENGEGDTVLVVVETEGKLYENPVLSDEGTLRAGVGISGVE